jgi:hypothetical protein
MAAWPDIVITRADSPEVLLAVEAKAGGADAEAAEAQIKDYMVHQSCPLGMIVTLRDTIFFRNRYTGYGPEAIQRIGECRTSELIEGVKEKPALSEADLIRLVDQWLDLTQRKPPVVAWFRSRRDGVVCAARGSEWRRARHRSAMAAHRHLTACVTCLWRPTGSTLMRRLLITSGWMR